MSETTHRTTRSGAERCRSGGLEILVDCPSCHARVHFVPNGQGPSRRLFARCCACGTGYSLYGGQLSEVHPRIPTPRAI